MPHRLIILSLLLLLTVHSKSNWSNKGKHLCDNLTPSFTDFSEKEIDQLADRTSINTDTLPRPNFRLVNTVSFIRPADLKQKLTDSLSVLKAIAGDVKAAVTNPVKLLKGKADYSGFADTSYISNQQAAYMDAKTLNSSWLFAGVPATVNVQSQAWNDVDNSHEVITVKFDRNNYLNRIKQRLSGKFDPAALINLPADPAAALIASAKSGLKDELTSLNQKYKGILEGEINSFTGGLNNLSSVDIKSLRQKLLTPELIQGVKEKENLLSALQQKVNVGEKINEADFAMLQNEVSKLRGVQEFIAKVEAHKQKWESSGLLNKIKEYGLLRQDKIRQLMNDPASVRKMAKQFLSLKGAEKFFLNVNRMNIGKQALSLSPATFRDFLSNGAVTEFLNKGKSILLMMGKQKDFNATADYAFSAILNSNAGVAKAARLELRKTKSFSSHIALASFNQSPLTQFTSVNAPDLRKILVTTISNDFTINKQGQLSVDISRSATQYRPTGIETDSTIGNKGPLSGLLSGNDLWANTAIAVRFSDELPGSGLNYQVSFNKTGDGYTNPGNSNMTNGSMELGISLRKTFLKQRLQVSVRSNGRQYDFGGYGTNKWLNTYSIIDARWKMKKGQYISLRYQPARMVRKDESKRSLVSSIDRVSADASVYHKFGKNSYRNVFSLSYLKSSYLFAADAIKNSTLSLNSFQQLSVGKNMLYVNTSYNNTANNTGYIYLNSSFSTESGITYPVFKMISMSSALTYNSVAGWYRQAGIRQTINGEISSKFSTGIYLDLRKNITVTQPLWNQAVRADISIRYIFGNNE